MCPQRGLYSNTVLRGRAFGKWLDHKCDAPVNDLNPLIDSLLNGLHRVGLFIIWQKTQELGHSDITDHIGIVKSEVSKGPSENKQVKLRVNREIDL